MEARRGEGVCYGRRGASLAARRQRHVEVRVTKGDRLWVWGLFCAFTWVLYFLEELGWRAAVSWACWSLRWKIRPLSACSLSSKHETKNRARCAGFLVVSVIYRVLNKRCPKGSESNVLQPPNTHHKETVARSFLGFPTPCSHLPSPSLLSPNAYSSSVGLLTPNEGEQKAFRSSLRWCSALLRGSLCSSVGCAARCSLLRGISFFFLFFSPQLFNQLC